MKVKIAHLVRYFSELLGKNEDKVDGWGEGDYLDEVQGAKRVYKIVDQAKLCLSETG